jgi:hypothetical protein
MVLSPAKTMDLRPLDARDYAHDEVTPVEILRIKDENGNESGCDVLCERMTTAKIVNSMKGKTKGELRSLLNMSGNLGKVAHQHWEDFTLDKDCNSSSSATDAGLDHHPAMFTFSGPPY